MGKVDFVALTAQNPRFGHYATKRTGLLAPSAELAVRSVTFPLTSTREFPAADSFLNISVGYCNLVGNVFSTSVLGWVQQQRTKSRL